MPSSSAKPIRLRDFVRVGDLYFSVVGYRNEKRVRCFLRYAPGKGGRFKDGKEYRKLSHAEAIEAGREFFSPSEGIFRVDYSRIDEVFKPEERLMDVMDAEVEKVVSFFSGIPENQMGVTGSRLIGLKSNESDVDFIIYGKYWFEGREKIKKGIERKKLLEPDSDTWEFIYRKRKPPLSYDAFIAHERRKYHRAFIGNTYFDLLYVRGYGELDKPIPEKTGEKLGKMKVIAEVTDDTSIFDYPAYYPIDHEKIKAVLSYTHTYAGQVFKGEVAEAYGVLEEINGDYYLIVGTTRETDDEYLVSKTLLERAGVKEYLNQNFY
ncbi:nucleotidyltransferase domain-containing protein [Geoglobus acetivorans]|uniref:DNA polymerase subunit beta n=1 Tax=Geoglobus acetivorans TaxID=565033 RepID=A0ABZ3H249_GEOAI|nr:DNA polymerase subunit beta [Geoglobus acetivorans]